jgi:hypothetical protein
VKFSERRLMMHQQQPLVDDIENKQALPTTEQATNGYKYPV